MSLYVRIRKNLGRFDLDVEFQVEREKLSILGESGCGKSLTLKCIAGIETPDEGLIVLNGRVLYDSSKRINLSPQARKAGYLFQNFALFPNMTVKDNIAICIPKSRNNRDQVLSELIRIFKLCDLEQSYPSQLSGGQQQRVALARIFTLDPEILMLDEPFSALDSHLKWQLELELMDILDRFNKPVLFVSHNRDEVFRICDRVAVFSSGRIDGISEKHDLFNQPKTLEAAMLTGCKNLSRAIKLGDYRLYAVDWGIELETADEVPERILSIGIRAHAFRRSDDDQDQNRMHCAVNRVVESPFSTLVVFNSITRSFEATEHPAFLSNRLRWEFEKPIGRTGSEQGFPASGYREFHLSLPPDQLLLLT